tara:strand:- start:112 stop:537 length:426 start_codon:yes stop_codon:yes gene_type:complete
MTSLALRTPALLGRTAFDQIFDQFFNDPIPMIKSSTNGYPLTDIYKDENNNQIIEMALAGFKKEELQIEAKENRINISADNVSNDGGAIERRIARRSFKKTYVDYHNQLDFDGATATFVDGLLRISIPPQKEEKAIEISIV